MANFERKVISIVFGLCTFGVGALGLSAPAYADRDKTTKPVLVELFTSQNCAACPSANKKLIELTEEIDIFPLTWSVSYWDYLGWTDTFAQDAFNARQRDYVDAFGLRAPYTPQTVIDGCAQTTGRPSRSKIRKKVKYVRKSHGMDVELAFDGNILTLMPGEGLPVLEVSQVSFEPGLSTVIPGRGANVNKKMTHINVVTGFEKLADWDGSAQASYDFDCTAKACVALIQEKESRDIVDYFHLSSTLSEITPDRNQMP